MFLSDEEIARASNYYTICVSDVMIFLKKLHSFFNTRNLPFVPIYKDVRAVLMEMAKHPQGGVLIVDIPFQDRMTLLKAYQKVNKRFKSIVLMFPGDDESREHAVKSAGADVIMKKPVDASDLGNKAIELIKQFMKEEDQKMQAIRAGESECGFFVKRNKGVLVIQIFGNFRKDYLDEFARKLEGQKSLVVSLNGVEEIDEDVLSFLKGMSESREIAFVVLKPGLKKKLLDKNFPQDMLFNTEYQAVNKIGLKLPVI